MDPISSLEADQAATRKARGLLSEKALERAEWNALASEILAEEDEEEGDMGMREEDGDVEYKVSCLNTMATTHRSVVTCRAWQLIHELLA